MTNDPTLDSFLEVFKGDVTHEQFRRWLVQFKDEHLPIIKALVRNFRYYSSQDVFSLLNHLWQKLADEHHVEAHLTWFIPTGYVAKSGDAIAYFFRRNNSLPEESFLRITDLSKARLSERSTVVFVDDFIGSGQDALRVATEIAEPLKAAIPETRFVFAAAVGYTEGIERLRQSNSIEICVVEKLDSTTKPFTSDSNIFPEASARQEAEKIVSSYCSVLKPKARLGYGHTQGLLGFFFGTPNNTLPIFWSSEGEWIPLLPYGDSLRDPSRLLETPHGARESFPGSVQPDQESVRLKDLNISKDATAFLYDGFQTLQNMTVAAQVFTGVGLTDATIHQLVEAIHKLQEEKHEGRPVSTALLFPKPEYLSVAKSRLFLEVAPPFSLADFEQLKALAQIIDGLSGAVLVGSEGSVHGLIRYVQPERTLDPFTPPCYLCAAGSSQETSGFLVVFGDSQRVTIFSRGVRLLSRRFAKWHIQGIPKNTENLEAEHGLHGGLLARALRLSFLLSDSGHGALITLGDHESVLLHSGKTAPETYTWPALSLFSGDDVPIVSLAEQDGAMVIDFDGQVQQVMTMLQPPADSNGDEETGKGARHNAASKISAVTGALAIAVSEDGPITIYSKGRRILRVMG